MEKEEHALVLDFLPYGYPLESYRNPVVQAVGKKTLTILHLAPRRDTSFEQKEEIYIGEGKRDKIQFIKGKLHREKLTETAKANLAEIIEDYVKENEKEFVKFFNEAQAINTRLHQFELLPGCGNKHSQAILTERDKGEFTSFEDINKRVPNLPDPQKIIEKRIFEEITEMQRHNLFIK
jgi:putative nucleotide binding protein